MSYTPIGWQTGDTITAEKMNKMDNGWDVQNTQLFSETLTTTAGNMGNSATMAYAGDPTTISAMTIVFDGTTYSCKQQSESGQYWWGAPNPSDFSEYPFVVLAMGDTWYLITETAGTYTVTGSAGSVETSANFQSAVNSFIDTSMMPMECVSGTTTYAEMLSAFKAGRIMFFKPYGNYNTAMVFITSFMSESAVAFVPTNAGITARISDGVFTVGIS